MSRRIDICPTCKGKGEIIVDDWLTEGMTEEEFAREKEQALADIVEVVRCKDCKHFTIDEGDSLGYCTCQKIPMNFVGELYPEENFYCSYGERSEE